MTTNKPVLKFTPYQSLIVAILAILQFTIILDFMVLSPLGAILMPKLGISPQHFGIVVSAYAFSAFVSGILAAGFADKFDRKKLLLFFYAGFLIGTLLCGLAPDFSSLLIARIVTGFFGGVIGSVSFAIITDLFPLEQRGRVMGFVQMSFSASQIMGIPVGLWLANEYGWHSPFLLIAGLGVILGLVILRYMKPVTEHLKLRSDKNPFLHLWHTVNNKTYLVGFGATALLAVGGFMMMPFSSTFIVRNVKIAEVDLPKIFFFTGLVSIIAGPLIGKLSDKVGKYRVFIVGSVLLTVMVWIYTNLGVAPIWQVILINAVLFLGVTARIISASALASAVPAPQDRGAYMGINASIQQVSGGIASVIGGSIIVEQKNGPLRHFDILGYLTIGMIAICIFMMYFINEIVRKKVAMAKGPHPVPTPEPVLQE